MKDKIVHLSKYYKPYLGGIESVVADVAEGTKCSRVVVLSVDVNGLKSSEVINDVSVFRSREWLNMFSTSISPAYILNVLRYSDNAILHVHLPNPMANLAILVSWLFRKKCKIVIHWHSDVVRQKVALFFYRPLQDWLVKKADKVIVTSRRYLDGSEQLANFKQKCEVIPIGISSMDQQVDPDKVDQIRSESNGRVIVFALGRHIYYKGFEVLIRSMIEVEDAVVLLGGSGPDTNTYKSLAQELNVEHKIKFIGRVSDEELASYYSAADIFCFPSVEKSEAFGVVQLEAMSVGTPVISTNIVGSGVPWVNKHLESGLVCEPKDVESLSNAMCRLVGDKKLRSTLACGAKARFQTFFDKHTMVESIEKLYSSL